ncbi:SagB/ThcOx family dehydrogenase [Variovorax paradoxus]|uniref:Nitroreductase family protein n=1 Tax=Variovorax paradoxus TaxID=34073 RepID=A0A0H2M834_VARPD|nr:SagB/ThcOx family dehydrogenase [Variovorax paradoxus]KLN53195.1 nitroreductase family protein [Variovorax paradoxus]
MTTLLIDAAGESIALPSPVPTSMSLDQALKRRSSTRAFLPDGLSLPALSALLWAACGVNREQQGGRTAPSAHNWKEIDVYAVLAAGTYRYEPRTHRLFLIRVGDLRAHTGLQDFVATAPLNLVYVADLGRMTEVDAPDRPFFAGADAGCIAQNVYLHCAAAGLATVVRAMIDRKQLARALGLPATQRIALAQTVGHAKP